MYYITIKIKKIHILIDKNIYLLEASLQNLLQHLLSIYSSIAFRSFFFNLFRISVMKRNTSTFNVLLVFWGVCADSFF